MSNILYHKWQIPPLIIAEGWGRWANHWVKGCVWNCTECCNYYSPQLGLTNRCFLLKVLVTSQFLSWIWIFDGLLRVSRNNRDTYLVLPPLKHIVLIKDLSNIHHTCVYLLSCEQSWLFCSLKHFFFLRWRDFLALLLNRSSQELSIGDGKLLFKYVKI